MRNVNREENYLGLELEIGYSLTMRNVNSGNSETTLKDFVLFINYEECKCIVLV